MIDGVIKYDFTFTPTKPLAKSLWEKIEQSRERLYALRLIGEKEGIGYGNISQRIDSKSFVITATQTGELPKLQAQHYAQVDAWDEKRFTLHASGAAKPSSEALTHGTIYNLSQEICAVIHIHSLSIWEFMLQNDYLQTDDVLYGSPQMVAETQRIYQGFDPLQNPKFVMRGHREGVIIFGRDLKEAELTLYAIIAEMLETTA